MFIVVEPGTERQNSEMLEKKFIFAEFTRLVNHVLMKAILMPENVFHSLDKASSLIVIVMLKSRAKYLLAWKNTRDSRHNKQLRVFILSISVTKWCAYA